LEAVRVCADEKLTALLELESVIRGGNYAPPAAHEQKAVSNGEQQCASNVRPRNYKAFRGIVWKKSGIVPYRRRSGA
jgi:hypothetical protein